MINEGTTVKVVKGKGQGLPDPDLIGGTGQTRRYKDGW